MISVHGWGRGEGDVWGTCQKLASKYGISQEFSRDIEFRGTRIFSRKVSQQEWYQRRFFWASKLESREPPVRRGKVSQLAWDWCGIPLLRTRSKGRDRLSRLDVVYPH